jgi:hypothetical protein
MDGGSRGWSIFNHGDLVYENGIAFERAIMRSGLLPDRRSDAKASSRNWNLVFRGTPMAFI